MKNLEHLELSAPWVNYYREIYAMFEYDDEVRVEYNEETYEIKLYVDNTDKAMALHELLPHEKSFGNVIVRVTIVPANRQNLTREELFRIVFKGNSNVNRIKSVKDVLSNPITYVAFRKEVVQYPLDNLHDINGNVSTLYEDVARDIFGEEEGICFCTDGDYYKIPYSSTKHGRSNF